MKRQRLAVFGGSFDPPHLGHLRIADAAVEQFRLDEIRWIPSAISPFKTTEVVSDASHRLAMVEFAIADRPQYSVSRIEIDRGGISFTVDTLRAIHETSPDAELFFLLGEDAFEEFESWHEPNEIRKLARLIVYPRGDGQHGRQYLKRSDRLLEGMNIHISSSEIRKRMARGESIDNWVTESVIKYIRSNGLYTPA